MALHVVVGAGPVGTATAELLAEHGHAVRMISRSRGSVSGSIERVALDAKDPPRLSEACAGAAAVYGCASPPYHRWVDDWPPLAAGLLDAAESAGAVLVLANNLYLYGAADSPMTEQLPAAPNTRKGRVRAQVWQDALARHEAGRLRVSEARASDFVGPGVTAGGHLAERVLPALLAGKQVRVLGDPDAPHSWTFVPDVARTLVRLAGDERAWGRPWHVPTPPPYSPRWAIERMCQIANVSTVRVGATPWWMVRLGGIGSPLLRELLEIRYQFDAPFVMDSSDYTTTFGQQPTAAEEALTATVEWWQAREASRS